MRRVIEQGGVVVNVVELPDDWMGAEGEWRPPEGATVRESAQAGIGWTWDGESFAPPVPVSPVDGMTLEQAQAWAHEVVNLERSRRRCGTRDYARAAVPVGEAVIPVDTRNTEDLDNMSGLLGVANAMLITGSPMTFDFTDADNVYHETLTAAEMVELCTGLAIAVKTRAIDWSWAVKGQVDAAETPAAVLEILVAEGLA